MTMEDIKLQLRQKIDDITNNMRLEMLRAEMDLRDFASKADNSETRERMLRRADSLRHHAKRLDEDA